jgi:cobalt-zinc-cadmium efflux system protein
LAPPRRLPALVIMGSVEQAGGSLDLIEAGRFVGSTEVGNDIHADRASLTSRRDHDGVRACELPPAVAAGYAGENCPLLNADRTVRSPHVGNGRGADGGGHDRSHNGNDHVHAAPGGGMHARADTTGDGGCCVPDAGGWRDFLPHSHRLSQRLAADKRTLLAALAVLCAACGGQALAGAASGSSALSAEAVHTALDGLTVVVSLVGAVVAARPPTAKMPYGYGRAETLAALASVVGLGVVCAGLAAGAVTRLAAVARGGAPHPVAGRLVFAAEAATLAANVSMTWVLTVRSTPSAASLNIRALRAHIIADSVENVIVLAAGLVLWAAPSLAIIDPVLTLLIVVLLVYLNAPIAREAMLTLLQAAPDNVDLAALRSTLVRLPHVVAVPALRAWTLTCSVPVVAAHLAVVASTPAPALDRVRRAARAAAAAAGAAVITVEVALVAVRRNRSLASDDGSDAEPEPGAATDQSGRPPVDV